MVRGPAQKQKHRRARGPKGRDKEEKASRVSEPPCCHVDVVLRRTSLLFYSPAAARPAAVTECGERFQSE